MKAPRGPVARRPWLAAAAAVVVLATAADAFARGGGGGNFGGGGGSGGGGGGGGGLIIWLLIRLLELAFRYPPIGVPLLLVTIFILWKASRATHTVYTGSVLRRGGDVLGAAREAAIVDGLKARDPAFDRTAFVSRVRAAFARTQTAWCAQDLAPIRPFVSDGVYERFALQLDEQRALGYRDRMDDLTVDSVTIAHAASEGAFDSVTVRIAATAADYRVSLTSGERVAGSELRESFVEYWTFLRRRGARPQGGGPGLLEGHCPNCGDAVLGNQFADCRSCKARLRSGEFDWVLAEITQGGEWTPRRVQAVPGVAELVADDPEFCVEAMEDRASVAFWRWAMAMRLADAKPLAGVAADEVVRAAAAASADGGAGRRYVGECGVGAVELLGVLRDDGVHHALVEVRWSGTEFEVRSGGAPRRLDRTGVRSWLLVFERSVSAKSRIDDAFSSAHCRSCGAPAEGAAAVCAYCSGPLTDVNLGWTLARMTTRSEAAGRVLVERLRAAPVASAAPTAPPPLEAPATAALVAWAAQVAASDGVVDPRERAGLLRLAARASIPVARLDEILADALAAGTELTMPESADEARAWLESAARTAVADGVVTPEETALLQRLAAPAGMSAADVRILVNRARADVYQEAKAALRRG